MYFRSHLLASYFMIKEAARVWGVREGCYFLMRQSWVDRTLHINNLRSCVMCTNKKSGRLMHIIGCGLDSIWKIGLHPN